MEEKYIQKVLSMNLGNRLNHLRAKSLHILNSYNKGHDCSNEISSLKVIINDEKHKNMFSTEFDFLGYNNYMSMDNLGFVITLYSITDELIKERGWEDFEKQGVR